MARRRGLTWTSATSWTLARLYVPVVLLGSWLVAVEVVGNELVVPAPSSVWEAMSASWTEGHLVDDVVITFVRIVAAFVLAVVVGAAVGIMIGRSRSVRLATRPLVAFGFPTPKAAIYPALVVLLGFGSASKIAFGFLEAVFPIVLATAAAASQVDERLIWSSRMMGTSNAKSLVRVVLPGALPGILTGARVGLVGAIIGVFLGEMIVGTDGLGQHMMHGWRRLRTADMYTGVILVSVMGLVLDRLFLAARRRLTAWSHEGDRH